MYKYWRVTFDTHTGELINEVKLTSTVLMNWNMDIYPDITNVIVPDVRGGRIQAVVEAKNHFLNKPEFELEDGRRVLWREFKLSQKPLQQLTDDEMEELINLRYTWAINQGYLGMARVIVTERGKTEGRHSRQSYFIIGEFQIRQVSRSKNPSEPISVYINNEKVFCSDEQFFIPGGWVKERLVSEYNKTLANEQRKHKKNLLRKLGVDI